MEYEGRAGSGKLGQGQYEMMQLAQYNIVWYDVKRDGMM